MADSRMPTGLFELVARHSRPMGRSVEKLCDHPVPHDDIQRA
jgi:hypothetical protein